MDKYRMNRSERRRRRKHDILKRIVVVALAVSMVSAWPLSSNMVFAENTGEPEQQTPAQQIEEQIQQGGGQEGESWDQEAITVEEPSVNGGSGGEAVQEGTGSSSSDENADSASGSEKASGQDKSEADQDKGPGKEDKKKDGSSDDKEDPADKYKDLMSLTELTSLPDTKAKATIWYVGKNTGRVTKERGWAVNDYYVNQPDSHYVKMKEDFTLKHQIEFTTTKDIGKGKIEIRVPLSLFDYDVDGEKTAVTPSAIGVPEGTPGSSVERNDTFFNYYISRGTGKDGADELVFFNYEKVPEGTASAWQVLYGKVEAAKIEKDAAWSFIPEAEVKTDEKTEKLEEGELAPLKGVVDLEAAEAAEEESANTEEEASQSEDASAQSEDASATAAEESAKADEEAPASLEELKDLDEDKASAISEIVKKSSNKGLLADDAGRPWKFDMYYVRQNSPDYVYKTDDFTLKYQIEFDTSQDIEANDVIIKVPASTVKYGHRGETRREIMPADVGIPQGSYDPETGEYGYTEARRSAFNYYISRGTGKDGEDELVFFNYRKITAGEKNAWQVRYAGDTSAGEEAFDVMEIEDGFSWRLDPEVTVRFLKPS